MAMFGTQWGIAIVTDESWNVKRDEHRNQKPPQRSTPGLPAIPEAILTDSVFDPSRRRADGECLGVEDRQKRPPTPTQFDVGIDGDQPARGVEQWSATVAAKKRRGVNDAAPPGARGCVSNGTLILLDACGIAQLVLGEAGDPHGLAAGGRGSIGQLEPAGPERGHAAMRGRKSPNHPAR